MAWLSAYLPADQAAGIWNRTTAAARALQGPDEARTLTQLRADVAATLAASSGPAPTPRQRRRRHRTAAQTPGMCRSRGRRSWSPSRCSRCWAPPRNRRCWTGTGRSRRRWPAGSSPTAPTRSTGSWSTRGTGPRWRSAGPATGSPRPCANGCGCATANARSRAATTLPGQRSRPPPRLGRRRHHRHHQPRPALPQTPPPQTHHRLDTHPASKNEPPGWTSPTGRHYPSEHQDWEPPHWPPGITATETVARSGFRPARGARLGPRPGPAAGPRPGSQPGPLDPGRDPDLDLPDDPFPDWHGLMSEYQWTAADRTDPGWSGSSDDACLKSTIQL